MLLSVTFSKPSSDIKETLGRDYKKIKIKLNSSSTGGTYFVEYFTETQTFHKTFSEAELTDFIKTHAGTTFKSCIERYDDKEVTTLANKKGKITRLEKKISQVEFSKPQSSSDNKKYFSKAQLTSASLENSNRSNTNNKIKNYIIREGTPVPFLITLGVMTPDGKIVNSKYDKFKQINRFLEYIDDVLPSVMQQKKNEDWPLQIADFGCGKSYLTFAVHYFLTVIKKIDCRIIGLDLKKDVIDYCNRLAEDFKCEGLIFKTGDISEYSDEEKKHNPDIVITLHACDTATDFALKYAVSKNAKAILSVPCCQHEVNRQLEANKKEISEQHAGLFAPILKHGLIRERFAALLTDSLRASYLEDSGYKVDVMEFIDMSHTPKNILLRAVKKSGTYKTHTTDNADNSTDITDLISKPEITNFLKIEPEIFR
ncbi:MAG: SAM-dependent methyltransferase [Treponema sp.]|nr:SAM-dependent methyltransferase [Candidatus Treponema merdequi]